MALDLLNQLHSEPETLRRFLDAMGDALFVVDTQQRIIYWNGRAELLTGYSASEVLGGSCQDGLHCEACETSCRLFETGEVRDSAVIIRNRDGKRLNVRKSAFVLRNDQGEVVGGVELLRDETDLVQRIDECRLQRQEIEGRDRLSQAILGSIREGILTIDDSWRITHFSRRAEALTGVRASDALGRFCHEIIGSDLCKTDCPAQHCLETGADEAERATRITTASGRVLAIAEIAAPLRDEKGRALGSVLVVDDRSLLGGVDVADDGRFAGMIGRSAMMRQVFRIVQQVAPTDATALVSGPSGSGKERVARAIHMLSQRRKHSFVAVNCAALPETLLESELFGHARGAFTGATRDRPGLIEEAQGGTLFLDEIGEMPLSLQAKLLRFLQEREFTRVGENLTRKADVRVVAASNRDLAESVRAGQFREDLYYRIKVIPISLPSLAQRREDIPLLSTNLLGEIAARHGREGMHLTPAAMQQLRGYDWPGNVRELINALEYAVTLAPSRHIRPDDLPAELHRGPGTTRYLSKDTTRESEPDRITQALSESGGNRSRAAELLGMNRVTLYRKLKKYGMS